MSAFDDEFEAVTAEVDPAAEFLAKEQEELGDIGEDLGLAPAQEIPAAREEFVGLQDQVRTSLTAPLTIISPSLHCISLPTTFLFLILLHCTPPPA